MTIVCCNCFNETGEGIPVMTTKSRNFVITRRIWHFVFQNFTKLYLYTKTCALIGPNNINHGNSVYNCLEKDFPHFTIKLKKKYYKVQN